MSIYKYQEPGSAIQEVAIRKTAGGGARAFLFAKDDIAPAQVSQIKRLLEDKHLSCVANEEDGRACLEVRGCKDAKVLEGLLRPAGFLKGSAKVERSENDKFSLKEFTRNNMVFIYGLINVVADAGMIAYGKIMKNVNNTLGKKSAWEDEASGWSYSAGSIAFTAFGRGDKSDFHTRDIAIALKKELQQRGIDLPADSAASSFESIKEKQGFFKKSQSYLLKGGSDAGNIATGTAGGLLLLGAVRNAKDENSKDRLVEGVLGTTTLLSGYGAALVKERAPDPENPPTTTLGKVKQWIQERPNRLAGYGYMVSTVAHAYKAYEGYKEAPNNKDLVNAGLVAQARRGHKFRGAFAGLNFLGEIILASASKGHGSGVVSDSSVEDTALAITADAIVRQPAAKRDALVRDLSKNFLANANVLGGEAENLEAKLYQQVHKLEENPWYQKAAGSRVLAADSATTSKAADGDKQWADGKVKKLVNDANKAASHAVAVEKSRAAASEVQLGS